MTDSMVERVARALCHQNYGSLSLPDDGGIARWIAMSPMQQSLWAEAARAAIEAMREPTEAQYEALSATGKMWREMNSREVWQTYIDAALKDAP